MSDLINSQSRKRRMAPGAMAALFIGIAGCEYGWAYGVPGIVLGMIASRKARKAAELLAAHPDLYYGDKMVAAAVKWSRVGRIQGICLTVFWALFWVAYIAVIVYYFIVRPYTG